MSESRGEITINGKTYRSGDTVEMEVDGKIVQHTVPDLDALSETAESEMELELTDEDLDAVSGGGCIAGTVDPTSNICYTPSYRCEVVCLNWDVFYLTYCFFMGNDEICYCATSGTTVNQFQRCPKGTGTRASDRRLKQEVRDVENALETLLALRGVTFEYTPESGLPSGPQTGFIAQELEDTLPDWVVERDGYKHLAPQGLSFQALTVEALRELQQRGDQLAEENEELRARLSKLEALVVESVPSA